MKIIGLRYALICGACLSAWPMPADARFLQADPVGYQDQTNLYAYVRNDPVNGSDPTGRFTIVYHGTDSEKARLRAIVERAAGAEARLGERHRALEGSSKVHDVYPVGGIFPRPQSRPVGENALENAQNGVGTGTRVVLTTEPITLRGQGVAGDDLPTSPEAVAAHELLSHSYENDRGENTGGPELGEQRAINTENIYRAASGEPPRLSHSPQERCVVDAATGRCQN